MLTARVRGWHAGAVITAVLMLATWAGPSAQQKAGGPPAPTHAKSVKRLLIKNAMVIYGNAKPAFGPVDILVENGLIARVGPTPKNDPAPDAVIDATGKYVMPGIINSHMHLQDERGGVPQPFQYQMNIYLASGSTTVRDQGTDWAKAKKWRDDSNL